MPSLLRSLTKNPGFTSIVVIVLALGVGANTAIFSVVNSVLLHPFPYPEADRILFVGQTREGQNGTMPVTYPDYLTWRESARGFEEVAFAAGRNVTLSGQSSPSVLNAATISASAWPLLGIEPVIGRVFTDAEDRPAAAPVCVLSHDTWQSRFGGDPAVLQRSAVLDGRAYTIIGVMPPTFKFWAGDVWIPVGLEASTDLLNSRVFRFNSWVVARTRPNVSVDAANTELNLIARQIAQAHPDTNDGIGARAIRLSDSVTGPIQAPLMVLLVAVGCVLLIACANVANLLLARTASRQREYAIRVALGATRAQLIRATLVESLPLSLLGGVAGLLVGAWGLQALLAVLPPDAIPAEAQIEVNTPVMAVSLGLVVVTMLLFSLLPALSGSRPQLTENLQEGARGTTNQRTARLRSTLIIAEISLSLTLLVGAGLLMRSLNRLTAVDPGFNTANLLAAGVSLPESRYPSGPQATQFFRQLVDEIDRLPAVDAVAATTNAPFLGGMGMPLLQEGVSYPTPDDLRGVQFAGVLGDYFRAQGVALVRGRTFTPADRAGSPPVVILNEQAARQFFPDGNALRQRVMLGIPENLIARDLLPEGFSNLPWAEVVGVVGDMRHFGLQREIQPAAFFPIEQLWSVPMMRNRMTLLARTHDDPAALTATVRTALGQIDPEQPAGTIATMDAVIDGTLRQSRFNSLLLGCFAGIALLLAVVGIYGVVAWNVTQRTREIGIRQALGAQRRDVLRLVVGQGMGVVLIGVAIGLLTSFAVARGLQSLLFEISAFDPWTFLLVGTLLGAVALLACLLPALRASRVSPLEALGND